MIREWEPWFGMEETCAVSNYVASGGWLTEYQETRQLEKMIADYVGIRHCVMVPNGTLALYAMLHVARVGLGDEVLVPAYTMVATANAVQMVGALPILVDIDPRTLCIDLEKAAEAITARTTTLIVVSLNGRAPDMDDARLFAERHGLLLLEDAAQALGSRWRDRPLGTFGTMGILSFSPAKIVSTGQGGCVLTDDDEYATGLRSFKNFGRLSAGTHEHLKFGINLKFTDLQAVIGIEQMKKLPSRVERKQEIFALYRDLLEGCPIKFLPTDLEQVCPWKVDVLVENRISLLEHLNERGIGAGSMYPALNTFPMYKSTGIEVAEYVGKHGVWLPSSAQLSNAQIEMICKEVKDFYER